MSFINVLWTGFFQQFTHSATHQNSLPVLCVKITTKYDPRHSVSSFHLDCHSFGWDLFLYCLLNTKLKTKNNRLKQTSIVWFKKTVTHLLLYTEVYVSPFFWIRLYVYRIPWSQSWYINKRNIFQILALIFIECSK